MMDGCCGQIRHPHAEPPAPGAVTEVAEGVLWLRVPLPLRLDHVNVYALDDGDGWTVIDTGFDTAEARAVWESLLAGPLAGKPVRRLVGTHHHPDHIGLAGWFGERGVELTTTRTAWLYARMLTLDVQEEHSPETLAFYRAAGMDPGIYDRLATRRPYNFADVVAPLPAGFTRLVEGGHIRMGGRDWRVRMGNGHAPEHATFWSEDDRLVIGGDQLLPGISPNIGVYSTEPEADPLAEWLESCRRFLPLADDTHFVLPGHKLPFTGLPLRLHQLIENHDHALERLLAHLDEPRRGGECFPPIFKRPIEAEIYGMALAETIAHLNHLWHTGRATRREVDGVWLWQKAHDAPA